MKKIKSLLELNNLSRNGGFYHSLTLKVSGDLGGPDGSFHKAMNYLETCAMETSEEQVVEEINWNIK